MRLIIGLSGSSGVIYGIRMLQMLADKPEIETHLVISQAARMNIGIETDWSVEDVEALADEVHGVRLEDIILRLFRGLHLFPLQRLYAALHVQDQVSTEPQQLRGARR